MHLGVDCVRACSKKTHFEPPYELQISAEQLSADSSLTETRYCLDCSLLFFFFPSGSLKIIVNHFQLFEMEVVKAKWLQNSLESKVFGFKDPTLNSGFKISGDMSKPRSFIMDSFICV